MTSEDIANLNAIQDPNTLAALQDKLGQMNIKRADSDSLDLPVAIRKRVNAIKNIQLQTTKLEAELYKEVHKLEIEYAKKYAPLYQRRMQIVNGEVEPTESECVMPGEEENSTPQVEKIRGRRPTDDWLSANQGPGFPDSVGCCLR